MDCQLTGDRLRIQNDLNKFDTWRKSIGSSSTYASARCCPQNAVTRHTAQQGGRDQVRDLEAAQCLKVPQPFALVVLL